MNKKILSSLIMSLIFLTVGFFSGSQVLSERTRTYLYGSTDIGSVSGDDLSKFYNVKFSNIEICGDYGIYTVDASGNYVCSNSMGKVVKYNDVNGEVQYIGIIYRREGELDELIKNDGKLLGRRGTLSQMPEGEGFAFQTYFDLFEHEEGEIRCFHINYVSLEEADITFEMIIGFGIMLVGVAAAAVEMITCIYKCKKEKKNK